MRRSVKHLMNGLIVSCQAYEDTPLYGSENMVKLAECAILGGAKGIRANGAQDIMAIRKITDMPIVGINKIFRSSIKDKNQIFITPTLESAIEVIDAGADILGIDCTPRGRSYDDVERLLISIRERYPDIVIMADISTADEGIRIAKTGLVDIISTTLAGNLSGLTRDGPDIEIIKELKENIAVPINAEGRIWDLTHYRGVLEAGADMVTIGTAITRPHLITKRFVDFNDQWHKK